MNSLKMSWGTIQHVEKKGNSKHTERVEASMLSPKGREESQRFRATSKLVPCVIIEKNLPSFRMMTLNVIKFHSESHSLHVPILIENPINMAIKIDKS